MDCELAEDGGDDVEVEDVVLGALFGEGVDGLVTPQSQHIRFRAEDGGLSYLCS